MGLLSLLGRIGDFAAFLSGEFIIISNGNQQGNISGDWEGYQGAMQVQQAQQQYNPHEFPMQDPQDVILYHDQVQREIEAQAQGMSRRNGRPVPINPSLNR